MKDLQDEIKEQGKDLCKQFEGTIQEVKFSLD
jgi:hypothetical protein